MILKIHPKQIDDFEECLDFSEKTITIYNPSFKPTIFVLCVCEECTSRKNRTIQNWLEGIGEPQELDSFYLWSLHLLERSWRSQTGRSIQLSPGVISVSWGFCQPPVLRFKGLLTTNKPLLVGGFNPSIGSSSQLLGKIKKMFQTTNQTNNNPLINDNKWLCVIYTTVL